MAGRKHGGVGVESGIKGTSVEAIWVKGRWQGKFQLSASKVPKREDMVDPDLDWWVPMSSYDSSHSASRWRKGYGQRSGKVAGPGGEPPYRKLCGDAVGSAEAGGTVGYVSVEDPKEGSVAAISGEFDLNASPVTCVTPVMTHGNSRGVRGVRGLYSKWH